MINIKEIFAFNLELLQRAINAEARVQELEKELKALKEAKSVKGEK